MVDSETFRIFQCRILRWFDFPRFVEVEKQVLKSVDWVSHNELMNATRLWNQQYYLKCT